MGTGSIPSDQIAYYAADLGETRVLAVTTASSALTEQLAPGRYLLQLIPSDDTAVTWVCAGAWDPTTPKTATAAAGKQRVPLSGKTIVTFEYNVRRGYNDALAAIASAGTANLYVTRISRDA